MSASETAGPRSVELPSDAELVFDSETIERAIDRVAIRMTLDLADQRPLFLCVLMGGLPFTWDLIRRLPIAMDLDYVHATRYRGTRGGRVEFHARPRTPLAGRSVVLVDDVLDEGITLEAVRAEFEAQAQSIHVAVLLDKPDARVAPVQPDYAALSAPNHFLVGRGMDFEGRFRNLPDIFRLPD